MLRETRRAIPARRASEIARRGTRRGKVGALPVVLGAVLMLRALSSSAVPAAIGAPTSSETGSLVESYRIGLADFREGRLGEAAKVFQDVAARASGYLKLCATNMDGQIARLEGRLPESLEAFARVMEQARGVRETTTNPIAARNAEVLGQLAGIYRGEILEERRMWTEAIAEYDRLIELHNNRVPEGEVSLVHCPAMYERIARLHWRVGQRTEATETFRQLLRTWPTCSRAPLVSLSLLVLEEGVDARNPDRRLGFLGSPPGGGQTLIPSGEAKSLQGLVPLPPPDPMLEKMHELVKRTPADSLWLPVLRLQYGGMLLEANQLEEARKQLEAVNVRVAGGHPPPEVVKGYARLSLAILASRQGRLNEGLEIAQAVAAKTKQGHLRDLANSIVASLGRKSQETKKGQKCGVEKLQ